MIQNCDPLFLIATGFPYAQWLPHKGQARGTEIDIDARMISIGYPMDARAKAAVRDPERVGIAAKGVRQKLTEVAEHLPGRHP